MNALALTSSARFAREQRHRCVPVALALVLRGAHVEMRCTTHLELRNADPKYAHDGEALPVALPAAIALSPLLLEDDHLILKSVLLNAKLHSGALDLRRTDDSFAPGAREENLLDREHRADGADKPRRADHAVGRHFELRAAEGNDGEVVGRPEEYVRHRDRRVRGGDAAAASGSGTARCTSGRPNERARPLSPRRSIVTEQLCAGSNGAGSNGAQVT
eukprot:CAMPEP_0179926802 /NCGR_PEP_ID=MMETSP0983-20121128/7975_1 /TAXON_ID=483367 /ORGANISM="non described non described, Strain CCMP 2436" /LENGTH=217 /DNA_ID=CAMNT_0021830457 /DNA_START=821 /DNA_END=1471 /DNA_ORIENTATION=-